ncbi:hypothetical protein SUGI_0085820 [Cryptomeria japonica]|nr:hypothetical protein SUGI_0085820 [Cryptomeria japonica]
MPSPALGCNSTIATASPACITPYATTPFVSLVGHAYVAFGVVSIGGGHGANLFASSVQGVFVVAVCGVFPPAMDPDVDDPCHGVGALPGTVPSVVSPPLANVVGSGCDAPRVNGDASIPHGDGDFPGISALMPSGVWVSGDSSRLGVAFALPFAGDVVVPSFSVEGVIMGTGVALYGTVVVVNVEGSKVSRPLAFSLGSPSLGECLLETFGCL